MKFTDEGKNRYAQLLPILGKEFSREAKYVNLAYPIYNNKKEFSDWIIATYEIVNIREKSTLFYKICDLRNSTKFYLKSVATTLVDGKIVITNSNVFTIKNDISATSVNIKKELERRKND